MLEDGRDRHGPAPPKHFEALYIPGRNSYSQQLRMLYYRVHNTTVFGARLSTIIATVVLLGVVMTLTMETDPAESSAYAIRRVDPSSALTQSTQTNALKAPANDVSRIQEHVIQAQAPPLTEHLAEQAAQPASVIQGSPEETAMLRHELPKPAFHSAALDPQLQPSHTHNNIVFGGEGVSSQLKVSKPGAA
jgi:hypothetical protein